MNEQVPDFNNHEKKDPWNYPEDRKPTEEEYKQDLKTNEDFLRVGPRFAAHYWARKSKEVNGGIDIGTVRNQLLQVFCQRNINDEAMKHFDDIATEAYMNER